MNKPSATGNFAATPFCELLVYALNEALSGTLVFECPDRSKHAVLLHFGKPVKARVDDPSVRLGEVLCRLGKIDAAARRAAETARDSQLFGQRLFSQGAIDEKGLAEGLDEQLAHQLAWLASAPAATVFAYYEHTDLLQNWGGEQRDIDPLAAIWRAIHGSAPAERVQAACDALSGKTLRLHPASRVGRFGFGSSARALLDVLRVKPQTLAELEATRLMTGPGLRELLYALVLTRHLDTGSQPLGVAAGTPAALQSGKAPPISMRRPVSSASVRRPSVARLPKAEPEPPQAAPPNKQERADAGQTGRFLTREEIEDKLRSFEVQSHYELFGIPASATPAEVSTAFTALARFWHPDRLSPDLADLRDAVTRVFARMTEAHRVLGQAASRQEYDRSLGAAGEDAEQAQVNKVLRAAESFQKAEILLKKRDLRGAEKYAELACAGDPSQPEYAALYAWIRARRPDATKDVFVESLAVLKSAASKQSENVKIRYYYACVLKLDGHDNAALREFRFVADRDPSNLDAARELRLHDMRRKNEPPEVREGSGGGLFERLFKR